MTPLKRTSPINRTRNLDESVFDEFGEKWAVTLYINTLPISTNPYLDEFGENGSGKWKSLHNFETVGGLPAESGDRKGGFGTPLAQNYLKKF